MTEEHRLRSRDFVVVATVKEVRADKDGRKCFGFLYREGDRVVFDGETIKGRLCYGAAERVIPKARAYLLDPERFKRYLEEVAKVPLPVPETLTVGCPDSRVPGGVVIFEIKKVSKREMPE